MADPRLPEAIEKRIGILEQLNDAPVGSWSNLRRAIAAELLRAAAQEQQFYRCFSDESRKQRANWLRGEAAALEAGEGER